MKVRRRWIERPQATQYLFTMLMAFAASILITRLYLDLSGYPQIGNDELHIAHVLWGGLLAAVGATLPLIYSNISVYRWSAWLNGIGLGLFFDEVGKFLTQSNDYFFRPAASIMYLLFLIGVLVLVRVRQGEPDAQTRLHHVLEMMQEIVDGDLDVKEKAELESLLKGVIGDASVPDVRDLAEELLEFVQKEADTVDAPSTPLRDWLATTTRSLRERVFTQPVTRWLIIIVAGILGLLSLWDVISLVGGLVNPDAAGELVRSWVVRGDIAGPQENTWFIGMVLLKGIIGLTLIAALILFLTGRERAGIYTASVGLIISIVAFDALLFYFEQFIAAARATLDFIIILGLGYYNASFLQKHSQSARTEQTA